MLLWKKHKHLTAARRGIIQAMLKGGSTHTEIAQELGVSEKKAALKHSSFKKSRRGESKGGYWKSP